MIGWTKTSVALPPNQEPMLCVVRSLEDGRPHWQETLQYERNSQRWMRKAHGADPCELNVIRTAILPDDQIVLWWRQMDWPEYYVIKQKPVVMRVPLHQVILDEYSKMHGQQPLVKMNDVYIAAIPLLFAANWLGATGVGRY